MGVVWGFEKKYLLVTLLAGARVLWGITASELRVCIRFLVGLYVGGPGTELG
jgi:hypothetical protein